MPFELPVITPDKGVDRWAIIDGLIRDYTKLHPEEVYEFADALKAARAEQRNKFASTPDKTMRRAISMPAELHILIKRYFPEVFNDKKLFRQFMQKFPGFTIPEKL